MSGAIPLLLHTFTALTGKNLLFSPSSLDFPLSSDDIFLNYRIQPSFFLSSLHFPATGHISHPFHIHMPEHILTTLL